MTGFQHWDRPHLTIETKAGASWRTRVAAGVARAAIRPPITVAAGLVERFGGPTQYLSPFALLERAAALAPPPRGIGRRSVQLPHCKAEWVSAPSIVAPGRAVIYFHGGGFTGCGLNTHRGLVSRISAASGAPVLNVAYRLLPRHPITEALDDGVDAWLRALEEGVPPDRIVLGGDSAGGLIAVSVALRALERGLPPAAGIVLISPWLDLDTSAKHQHPNARLDPAIPVSGLDLVVDRYISQGRGLDPWLSPVNRELKGLPPTLIQVGSTEVLRLDAELFADRLADAQVPVRLQVWDRQIHDFQLGSTKEANAAIEEIGAFTRHAMLPSVLAQIDGHRAQEDAA